MAPQNYVLLIHNPSFLSVLIPSLHEKIWLCIKVQADPDAGAGGGPWATKAPTIDTWESSGLIGLKVVCSSDTWI